VVGDGASAVRLTGASCAGDLELHGLRAKGVVNLRTATVGGRVVLDDARLRGADREDANAQRGHSSGRPGEPGGRRPEEWWGPEALLGEGLSTRGDFSVQRADVLGELRLTTAQIGGTLTLAGSRLANPEGRALQADRSSIGSGLFALDGFTARGSLVLRDARIDGPVIFSGGQIEATNGRAFNGAGLSTTGGFYGGRFRFEGQLRLTSCQIGGPLDLTGAELIACGRDGAEKTVALSAAGAVIDGEVRASGLTATGTVDLSTVRVSGHLRMTDATIRDAGEEGTGSLILSAGTVTGSVELDRLTVAGHVDVRVAKVTDHVRLTDARLRGSGGRSLRGTGLRAAQLRIRLAEPPGGRIGLAGATVDVLADHAASWPTSVPPRPDGNRPFVLDGFTYQRIESTLDVGERLQWLARGNPTFEPQPYEQLAACYRQMGREREARRVLREKTRRQHAAAGKFGRVWGWIQQLAVGYGYQPGRAVGWFLGLLAAGTIWFSQARCPQLGQDGVCPIKADEHPAWDPLLYTLDLLIPVVDIGHDRAWDPVGADKIAAVALMAAGWVLVTTLVAAAGRALNRA
jgi:cytoskeletal protein CcmA (bactofilin family)